MSALIRPPVASLRDRFGHLLPAPALAPVLAKRGKRGYAGRRQEYGGGGHIIPPMPNPPPAGISIREAVREDERAIRAMVRAERLNPLNLDWRNFLVAEDLKRRIVGIGAVKTHGDGSRELASVAVAPVWRGRGVAGAVIREILARESSSAAGDGKPMLYLTCRDSMAVFYERFGFRKFGREEMPPYFRRLHRLFSIVSGAFRNKNRLAVMKWGS